MRFFIAIDLPEEIKRILLMKHNSSVNSFNNR